MSQAIIEALISNAETDICFPMKWITLFDALVAITLVSCFGVAVFYLVALFLGSRKKRELITQIGEKSLSRGDHVHGGHRAESTNSTGAGGWQGKYSEKEGELGKTAGVGGKGNRKSRMTKISAPAASMEIRDLTVKIKNEFVRNERAKRALIQRYASADSIKINVTGEANRITHFYSLRLPYFIVALRARYRFGGETTRFC